jgi:hypothetical protein
VSFVVHRAGEKWMCASAQSTHVLPNTEPGGADAAGVLGHGSDRAS